MVSSPSTPCSAPWCPNLQPCPVHPGGRKADGSTYAGSRQRWQQLRAEVMLRDNYTCRSCGAPATQVDHMQPIHLGGPGDDPANLQALCAACHQLKTTAETRQRWGH